MAFMGYHGVTRNVLAKKNKYSKLILEIQRHTFS